MGYGVMAYLVDTDDNEQTEYATDKSRGTLNMRKNNGGICLKSLIRTLSLKPNFN